MHGWQWFCVWCEDGMTNEKQQPKHTANEQVRKNADVNLSVCHCYIGRWLNRERKSHNEFAFLFIFSLCTYYNVFFFLLVSCVFISIFTLNVGVEWKKKSSITLIRILDRIALHNWRAICHKFNNDDWQEKTQTNIQNINQQPKTSSHQHYCGTLSECACIGLLALMASLSKFI